jgi:hypothetical protein
VRKHAAVIFSMLQGNFRAGEHRAGAYQLGPWQDCATPQNPLHEPVSDSGNIICIPRFAAPKAVSGASASIFLWKTSRL